MIGNVVMRSGLRSLKIARLFCFRVGKLECGQNRTGTGSRPVVEDAAAVKEGCTRCRNGGRREVKGNGVVRSED